MSKAEKLMRCRHWVLKRFSELVGVTVKLTGFIRWVAVLSPLIRWSGNHNCRLSWFSPVPDTIFWIYYMQWGTKTCDNRHLSRSSVMKHLNKAGVPVFRKPHMTVNLEEVSLIIIKLLVLVSGPESILGFGVLDRSHENFRRIGKVHRSVYCFLCFIQMFHIPLLIYIQLIKNDDSQSFRVCCFVDNIIDSVSELWIPVRCDANKD